MKFFWGYKTPSAALYDLTKHKGPYRWYGITIGEYFIGFMGSGWRKGEHE